jgi:hypothetical protein
MQSEMEEVSNLQGATLSDIRNKLLHLLVSHQKMMEEHRRIFDNLAALTLQVNTMVAEEVIEPGSSSAPTSSATSFASMSSVPMSSVPMSSAPMSFSPPPGLYVQKFGGRQDLVPPPLPLSFAPFPDVARPRPMYSQVLQQESPVSSEPRYSDKPWAHAQDWTAPYTGGSSGDATASASVAAGGVGGGGGGGGGGSGGGSGGGGSGGSGGISVTGEIGVTLAQKPAQRLETPQDRFARVVLEVLVHYREVGMHKAQKAGTPFFAQYLVGQKIHDMVQKHERDYSPGVRSVLPPSPNKHPSYTGPSFQDLLMSIPGMKQSTLMRKKKVVACFAFDP